MKSFAAAFLTIVAVGSLYAQQQPSANSAAREESAPTALSQSANLPVESIGKNDLIGISVYDSPELTRTVRVDTNGFIRLPMIQEHIQAAGLYPEELENVIKKTLIDEQVLVDPIVTVSIVEYRSRPINVLGAVRSPLTFQAGGPVSLLDAISRAGGLAENAGPEILVSSQQPGADGKPSTQVQRISARGLLDGTDPALNLQLQGGEIIRIPEAGRFFVVGAVKDPGQFAILNGSESSVLQAMALTKGLDTFSEPVAYIYRTEAGQGNKNEIPVNLKKIMTRKSPDVPLLANDILYVPEATGRKTAANIARGVATLGLAITNTLIYLYR